MESCTILTRPPTLDLLRVLDRMPAMLLSRDLKTWLHGTTEEAQTAALTSWRTGILSVRAASASLLGRLIQPQGRLVLRGTRSEHNVWLTWTP